MPKLDYFVLADYVRQDNNVTHIMGAGIDTIGAPAVPTVQQLGIALRISFDTTEPVGDQHYLTVSFVGPDQPVMTARAQFLTPPRAPDVPEHWRTAANVVLQVPVPLPRYGDYSCEVDIDDGAITEAVEFRVIPPPGITQG